MTSCSLPSSTRPFDHTNADGEELSAVLPARVRRIFTLANPPLEIRDRLITRTMHHTDHKYTTANTYPQAVLECLKAGVAPKSQVAINTVLKFLDFMKENPEATLAWGLKDSGGERQYVVPYRAGRGQTQDHGVFPEGQEQLLCLQQDHCFVPRR